ncbi:MAG: trypsin-like peptidase domain-containing protein [Pirellulales bacterium]|nr:trypsin-like peptidase domain-containing protein [Pirellulales bacterium]
MADRPAPLISYCRWAACVGLVAVWGFSAGQPLVCGSELRQTPIVKAVQRARPSVVNIRGEKTITSDAQTSQETGRRVNGMGTGVVVDSRGYLLTNHHVVDGVREIQVTMADGQRYTARLVARDPETDLAVIKIDPAQPLEPVLVGTSSDLMPGEPVVAVGNAYGYEHTVTRGIISALHRAVQVSDAQYYEDLIQTDASINPGNSGGPLLNIDGEMIGINVAVRAGAQGIGFAIPVDKAMAVTAGLLASCNLKQNWHGVVLASDVRMGERGLAVASVDPKSPAAQAGLQPGDVVSSVGEVQLHRALDFHRAMLERRTGEQLALSVWRGDESLNLELTLASPPAAARPAASPTWESLGMELKPIAPEEFRQRFQTRYRGGLAVAAVRPNSPAAAQGIHQGDVLVGMHIWETISLENVAYILNRSDFASMVPVKFFILRGNETLYGFLSLNVQSATLQR